MRLYDPESPFVLVDPTEIERPQAKNTDYVGRLSDGKTLGFWMIVFAQPYRGRAIPFHFGVYSEATLNEEITSRNLQWRDLVWEIKELVGETPLVFDREFSAQRWLEALEEAGLEWVVRLNTNSGVKITDDEFEGEEIPLVIEKGQKRQLEGVYYRGRLKVSVSGIWPKDQREPLWVMGSLEPGRLVEVYEQRMKIEQTFKDAKSLLEMEKVMNKKRGHLQITLALVLLAYGLGLMVGEAARDAAYGDGDGDDDEREGDEKGVLRSGPTKVGALFWTIRAVEEAAEAQRWAVASNPIGCVCAVRKTPVSAYA